MNSSSYASVEETLAGPISYKIQSREIFQRSWWSLSGLVVPAVAVFFGGVLSWIEDSTTDLEFYYQSYKDDHRILVASALIGIAVLCYCHYLFSTKSQDRETEVSVTICPLGIQRTKKITTIWNNNSDRPRRSVRNYPFLCMEIVKDCILLEHVGGFSVTTHVMIRTCSSDERSEPGLVSAFPDAILTFDQCHDLVQEIQWALGELR